MKNNSNILSSPAQWGGREGLLLLFLIVFVSRLPFLYAGYGVEEDSWVIALEAIHSHLSGKYIPSRMPGHPAQELILTALWDKGPVVFNLLSAFFSAVGVLFFALILKHLQFRHFFLAALAFAFVPVYFISSTYTIDFVWSEAFVLASLYCLLKNNFIVSGIYLGLAVGCRITCGAMLIPFFIILWQGDNLKQTVIAFLKISVVMFLAAMLCFLPLIRQYDLSFFMYYDQFPYPPITKVLYKMIIGVFGVIGVLAIIISIVTLITKRRKVEFAKLYTQPLDKKIIIAGIVIIILYSVSYLRLPQKAGYMIPVIPFVILLFGYYLNSKSFKLLCYAFILSPFICGINLTDKRRGSERSDYAILFTVSGQEVFFDFLTGPLFTDYSKRKQKIKFTNDVIRTANSIREKTVIISGWWYNEIMVTEIPLDKNKFVIFEPYIYREKINEYLADNYKLFYLPEQNIYNDEMFKMSITSSVASPLHLLSRAEEGGRNEIN